MLTPQRRALFEASLSALLLPSDPKRPAPPLISGAAQQYKDLSDKSLQSRAEPIERGDQG